MDGGRPTFSRCHGGNGSRESAGTRRREEESDGILRTVEFSMRGHGRIILQYCHYYQAILLVEGWTVGGRESDGDVHK